ncbi:beta-2 adrenergic receptor-like [Callorhinchus milii]|uniref:beta-2 adrenergic receptor-like n=1 Tax=Callorhinchus milii TaxID=7868 RepID=UPI001C3FC8A4|nr:beta-2 adrenergic receptor-like [Callorhinchus milii]
MSYTLDNVALVTLNTVYATSIVLTNLLLIVALLNSSTLLRKNNYLYTLSISLSDLLVGAGWLYNGLHRNADDGNISYRSPEEVFLSIHSISMITFLGAVIDRYYAVQHPFRYVRVMTRTKVVVIIAFVWLIPLTFLSLQSLAPTNYSVASRGYSTTAFSILMIGSIVTLNVRIYVIVKKQQERDGYNARSSKNNSTLLIVLAAAIFITLWAPSMIYTAICSTANVCQRFPKEHLSSCRTSE